MEIFLLGDTENLHPDLNNKLKTEIGKRGHKIAYISSSPQDARRFWYLNSVSEYQGIDPASSLEYFDLSKQFSDQQLQQTLEYGTIHLSGGNTFEFLDYINKRRFGHILKSHLSHGGLIVGVSAGAIVLTPTIKIANLSFADPNEVGIKNLTALNFVDFEFMPHYSNSPDEIAEVKSYADKLAHPVYVTNDRGGIFVENANVTLYGEAAKI